MCSHYADSAVYSGRVLMELSTSNGLSCSEPGTFPLRLAILSIWEDDYEKLIILERYLSAST